MSGLLETGIINKSEHQRETQPGGVLTDREGAGETTINKRAGSLKVFNLKYLLCHHCKMLMWHAYELFND